MILQLFIIGIVVITICFIINNITKNMRYKNLQKAPMQQYINNYGNVEKKCKDKVILSFTTTPDRIKYITPMLLSLLDQTARADQIAMNIPEKCNDCSYDVPEQYKDICNVYTVGKDYGIGTKYVPTLLREDNCGTKIILLDDNKIYGKDFIEKIVQESDKYPDKVIYVGPEFKGSTAILIKPEFIDSINHGKCDDIWLLNNLKADKIMLDYKDNKDYL
jgi:hypothetical protein